MSEVSKLRAVAKKHFPTYPNIDTAGYDELIYCIDAGLDGWSEAIDWLHDEREMFKEAIKSQELEDDNG